MRTLSVDGHEPGGTVELSGPGTVSVHAAVRSIFPLRSLEIVRDGGIDHLAWLEWPFAEALRALEERGRG